jgi:hypothetical protein
MMSNQKWVQNLMWVVIFLNLVVLSQVFIIPRIHFIANHFQQDPETLRESQGPLDMPNQYSKTYRMMRQVRDMTGEDELLLLPPDNWEFGSPRAAVIQMLYPRKVYFSGDKGFEGILSRALSLKGTYVIFNNQWGKELCVGRSIKRLVGQGFGICRLD